MAPQRKKESLWRVFPLDFEGLIQGDLNLEATRFRYFGLQNSRELAVDEIFKSLAQLVKTLYPDSVCPDTFQVIGHAIDRINVSLSRATRSLVNLWGRLEGSV
jgi:hypothetical protein